MKTAQQVLLTIGATFALATAAILLTNLLTSTGSPRSNIGSIFAPNSSSLQLQTIIYWVFGLLLFAVAVSVNRFHQPLATAIGSPGIFLMTFGGFWASFFFSSALGAITLNFVTATVCLGGIFLICRNDKLAKYAPIYGANPSTGDPSKMAPYPQTYPQAAPQAQPGPQQVPAQGVVQPGTHPANSPTTRPDGQP